MIKITLRPSPVPSALKGKIRDLNSYRHILGEALTVNTQYRNL